MSSSSFTRIALVALALAGCAATAADDDTTSSEDAVTESPQAIQANDVSVLFPLARTKSAFEKGYLTPDAAGRGGVLLPEAIYKPGTLPESATPGVARTDLRLVSLRFDPCFAELGPVTASTKCDNQLRVVFQPLGFANGTATAKDAAVHAFYALTRAELTAAIDDIRKLRLEHDSTSLMGTLGPHPIMQKQGLEGTMAAGVNAIVQKYAGAANLMRFTIFSTSGLGTAWNFRGFEVAKDGTTTPMTIPTVPAGTKTVAFFRGFSKDKLSGDFQPPTSSADNLQLLANEATAKAATQAARKAANDALARIEDPSLHSPNTIDCASCHAAEPIRRMQSERKTDLNVHMFSYKDVTSSIHQRTVAETKAIAKLMNELGAK